jgi:hypothetical protein
MMPLHGRDRFDRKVDHTFDAKPDTLEGIEVITGAGRRRSQPLDVKDCDGEPGGRRRHVRDGTSAWDSPQQLFAWRKQVRDSCAAACASASAIDPATARSAPIRALLLTHDALH